eukprot:1425684-Pyramimonas_sp.AAC.1
MQSRGIAVLPSDHWIESYDGVTPTDWHAKQNNHNLAMMTTQFCDAVCQMLSQLLCVDPVITITAVPISTSTLDSRHRIAGLHTGYRDHGRSPLPRENDYRAEKASQPHDADEPDCRGNGSLRLDGFLR